MKKILKPYLEANPWDVKMPLIMVIFALSALIVSIFSKGFILESMYWFIGLLPIFFALTTVNFVLKKYTGERRNNLIRRMIFTSSLSFIFILVDFIAPEWKHTLLIVVSLGGLGYFVYDYGVQSKLYSILKNKPNKIILNEDRFRKVMETNCSRHVFEQYIHKIKDKQKKSSLLKKFRSFGYKKTHLFPTSKDSLFEIILREVFGIDFKF